MNINKELVNGVIDAVIDFVSACANDVCTEGKEEYVIFDGSIKSDADGNLKTYSHSGDLVAQVPMRPILTNLKKLGHNVVDLLEADAVERKAKAEAEAAAEAAEIEKEKQEVEDRIFDLKEEISSLNLRKKAVKRF